jgi:hypothetical protein
MSQTLDQFLHRWRDCGLLGYPDQKVEMVGQDAPGEDLDPQNREYSRRKERNFSRSRSSKTRFLSTTLETQW